MNVLRNTAFTYEEELKKHSKLKESDVHKLREWCAKQPHLPKISDVQLAVFLHCCDFSVEATKTRIESYFTMRTHAPEFFSNRDPFESEGLRLTIKNTAYVRLKKLTDDGYVTVYTKWIDCNPTHFNYNDYIKYANMMYDLWIHTEGSYPGYQMVLNTQGLTMGHVSRLNPIGIKKCVLYLQDAFPARIKKIHVVNVVPAVDIIMRMVKRFMKKELIEMIHLHSTTETLAKFVPLDALPNEDGGNGGTLANLMAEGTTWLENNRAWFRTEEETMRVNASLRSGKGKSSSDVFGVDGSFNELEFD